MVITYVYLHSLSNTHNHLLFLALKIRGGPQKLDSGLGVNSGLI